MQFTKIFAGAVALMAASAVATPAPKLSVRDLNDQANSTCNGKTSVLGE